MDFSAQKLDLIQWIAELKDVSLLKRIQELRLKSIDSDWASMLTEEEKTSVSSGLEDIEKGKVIEHTEVQKRYAKWL